jgi:H+/Cl- antiporter ClcA
MEQVGKVIAAVGVVLVVVGLLVWVAADKLSWLGHLPGDIRVERPGWRVYAPLTTMLLLSGLLSIVMWLVGKLFR